MNRAKSLGALWEEYLFGMASTLVDSLGPSDQTQVINAICQANAPSQPNTPCATQPRPGAYQTGRESPLLHLEEQWKAALGNSGPPQRIGLADDGVLEQRWANLNQHRIESIQLQIERMDCLLERCKRNRIEAAQKSRLLNHYQAIKENYTIYLEALTVAQRHRISC